MKGFKIDIEKETLENSDYRRVLYTAPHCQLVVMSLEPGLEIGEEVHTQDQFFRIEKGQGTVIINDNEYSVQDGDAIIVPAGSKHNVINTSLDMPLQLYTLYSPPHHKDGTVQKTKADEYEESFDGVTTE